MDGNMWHIIIQPIKKIYKPSGALGFSTLPNNDKVINFRIISALAAASLRVRVGSFTSCKEFWRRLFVTSNGTISCKERFKVTVFWSLFWYARILTPLVTLPFPTINTSIFPSLQLILLYYLLLVIRYLLFAIFLQLNYFYIYLNMCDVLATLSNIHF